MNRELALDRLLDLWDNRLGGLRQVEDALGDLSLRRKHGLAPFGADLPRTGERTNRTCGRTRTKEFVERVVTLRHMGMSYKRIAEEVECSIGTVNNALNLAAGIYGAYERDGDNVYGKSAYSAVASSFFGEESD